MHSSCTCQDRGAPCPQHDGVRCAVCGSEHVLPADSVPGQGSDACVARICENCVELGHEGLRYQCDACGLYACGEHIGTYEDGTWCGICLAKARVAAEMEIAS